MLEVRPVGKGSSVEDVLAEYRSGPGKGVAGVPEEVLMDPLPEEDWEALRNDDRNPW